ncbi:MAG: GNAT family N-acetyltransferase [Lachnospiraceae bacterium]|nr:GNAT family N-acetyltransferase [Lachnospiraceae bacterium]
MAEINYKSLFEHMHPDFFEKEHIRNIPGGEVYSEMVLDPSSFDSGIYGKQFADNITFGKYNGDLTELHDAVEKVIPHWIPFFTEASEVYCGYVDGHIASFCMIEDMGTYEENGVTCKIGGPGCVGTLPEFRNLGIGLSMVRDVTQIFKKRGYDLSYIHYTGVPQWYAKLGYKTVLTWDRKGIL